MSKRIRRAVATLFFGGLAATHVAALAGFVLGSWPLGIAADGLYLLALFDGALGLGLLARAGSRRAGAWALMAGIGCGALTWGPGAALSPDPNWGWRGMFEARAAKETGSSVFKARVLQANVEALGVRPAAIEGLEFDVAAIAEWQPGDDQSWARERGLELVSFDPARSDVALFSRWPALEQGCMADASGRCQAQWARLDTPGGPIRVASLHTLSPQKGWRSQSRDEFMERFAREVGAWPAGEPALAAGDFNATWATRSMRDFAAQGSWNGGARLRPTWPTFAARWGVGFRIDHVLASRGARVTNHRTFDSGYSDHLWSMADVEITVAAPAGADGRRR